MQRPWSARNASSTPKVGAAAAPIVGATSNRLASTIAADELEAVVGAAESEPTVIPDAKLWLDWLRFLEGAAVNGGLLVRP